MYIYNIYYKLDISILHTYIVRVHIIIMYTHKRAHTYAHTNTPT